MPVLQRPQGPGTPPQPPLRTKENRVLLWFVVIPIAALMLLGGLFRGCSWMKGCAGRKIAAVTNTTPRLVQPNTVVRDVAYERDVYWTTQVVFDPKEHAFALAVGMPKPGSVIDITWHQDRCAFNSETPPWQYVTPAGDPKTPVMQHWYNTQVWPVRKGAAYGQLIGAFAAETEPDEYSGYEVVKGKKYFPIQPFSGDEWKPEETVTVRVPKGIPENAAFYIGAQDRLLRGEQANNRGRWVFTIANRKKP